MTAAIRASEIGYSKMSGSNPDDKQQEPSVITQSATHLCAPRIRFGYEDVSGSNASFSGPRCSR